ncbi:hypothetical protein [Acanthopleuribacter pedis]|uniref:Uncharacterized protein n=1 Tax=Acanthopleuribacter pedis TaxID=442870 RepID=A0A8J7QJN6_9BACT|nr:hypothetical protein [Acanthopleuribacter pedis]MBO1319435.1 hypothetical protein [Acanthopleuribacter pedis]
MPISFTETLESLKHDHYKPFVLWTIAVSAVLLLWVAWFVGRPLPLVAHGHDGLLTAVTLPDGSAAWTFRAAFSPGDALAHVVPGSTALIQLDGLAEPRFGRLQGVVGTRGPAAADGRIPVDFAVDAAAFKVPLQDGLRGRARVHVGQATPLQRVLAALGRRHVTAEAAP